MNKTYTIEQMKRAFYEVFSAQGECWFSYFTEAGATDAENKAHHDSYVDPYWEEFIEKIKALYDIETGHENIMGITKEKLYQEFKERLMREINEEMNGMIKALKELEDEHS